MPRFLPCFAASLLCVACTGEAGIVPPCTTTIVGTVPAAVGEASGLAASRAHPGIFWTHNDSGGDADLFAIDSAGRLLGRMRVTGAHNVDWEDIALGPCPAGDCLYIADTGDNHARREIAAIYRVAEPSPDATATAPADRLPIAFPDGPRDVEALFIDPAGNLFLVSKGTHGPIALYRYPAPLRPGDTILLTRVQELAPHPPLPTRRVTAADASPDGRWVAIRTYIEVAFFRLLDDRLVPLPDPTTFPLPNPAEPQGEALAFRRDGAIFLASENGPHDAPGPITRLACRLR